MHLNHDDLQYIHDIFLNPASPPFDVDFPLHRSSNLGYLLNPWRYCNVTVKGVALTHLGHRLITSKSGDSRYDNAFGIRTGRRLSTV